MPLPSFLPAEHGERREFNALLAGMPLLRRGAMHCMDTALWLPNHRHDHAELHYVHRGRLDVDLPGRVPRRLVASGGWFMLTAPLRVHRARDGIMPPAQLLWVQLDPGRDDTAHGTPFDTAALIRLRRALRARYDSAWPAPPAAAEVFRRLRGLLPAAGDPLVASAVRAALAELLVLAAQPSGGRPPPPALDRALAALAADPPCTVPAAARAAGISPGTLHALYGEHLGATPAAWQLARRLDRARDRIAAGEAVADVARTLGFSSPRYFAHAFRREVGIAPSLFAGLRARVCSEPTLAW